MKYTQSTSAYLRSLSLIIAFLAVTKVCNAQKIRLGLTGAPTVSWLKSNSNDLSTSKTRAGFSYGVITDFGFGENYAFGTGVNVTYKGGAYNITKDNVSTTSTTRLQYIEIPLTLKMKTNLIGQFRYYGQFGVGANINIRSRGDIDRTNTLTGITTHSDNADITSDVNIFGLSMIFAAGTEFPVNGNTSLFGGITFNNGITDIINHDQKAVVNYLALNLGVFF